MEVFRKKRCPSCRRMNLWQFYLFFCDDLRRGNHRVIKGDRDQQQVVHSICISRQKLLTVQEIMSLADGRILSAGDALEAKLIDQVAYLDETVDAMKRALNIEQARVITYIRPKTFKSNIYSEAQLQGPSVINLISISAEEISFLSGVHFMYLWHPQQVMNQSTPIAKKRP